MTRKRFVAALAALITAAGLTTAACVEYSTHAHSPTAGAATVRPHARPRALDIFKRMNDERHARGLARLRWDQHLADYAVHWSETMAKQHKMHHSDIGRLLGRYNYVGENIAWGSAHTHTGALHVGWMRSTEHRDNMLAPGFQNAGVGIACASDGTIWATVNFARPASSGPPTFASGDAPPQPIVRTDPNRLGCD